MATYTSYLNLEKPTTSETFNLLKMNQNWDKIDAGVSALNSNLGKVLTGAWTCTSSSAARTKLTDSITLDKGTWLVVVTVPVVSSGTANVTMGPQSGTIDNNQFGSANEGGGQALRIVNVSSTQEVYGMSGGSDAVTYNSEFLERGGIRAVKIGM